MGSTFHLTFARRPADTSPGTFVATLWDGATAEVAHRTIVVADDLQRLAMELGKGASGTPDANALREAGDLLQGVLRGAGADLDDPGGDGADQSPDFERLLNLLLNQAGMRLVVHLLPSLAAGDRELLENLPWSALENQADGRLRVVLHADAEDPDPLVMPELRSERNRISNATGEVNPALRVLVVVLSLDQPNGTGTKTHRDVAAPVAAAQLRALRQIGVDAAANAAATGRSLALRVVAPKRVLGMLSAPGLGAVALGSRDELRAILRGERKVDGIATFDVIHFIGHSDATATQPATRLLCGFQAIDFQQTEALRTHPATDSLTAAELAQDLQAHGASRRTVLCVFDNCKVGATFLRPVLAVVDHAIGTLGLVPAGLGALWTATFYQHLASFEPIGTALLAARQAIRDPGTTSNLRHLWWQLTHWTSTDLDQPFGTADGFALQEYAQHQRRLLRDLEGEFRGHELRHIAIPLAIERIAEGRTPQEGDRGVDGGGSGDAELGRQAWWRRSEADLLLAELVREGGYWFLLGEPGGGKTTLQRCEASRLLDGLDQANTADTADTDADDVATTSNALVPVYVRLPEFLRWSERAPTLERLLQFALQDIPQPHRQRLVTLLTTNVSRLVLLLDGWDEIPQRRGDDDPDHLDTAQKLVAALVDTSGPRVHALVIACRFAARPQPMHGVSELKVLPLRHDHQLALLTRWFAAAGRNDAAAGKQAQSVLDTLQRQPGSLKQLAAIPLYLGLLGRMAASQTASGLAALLGKIHRRHEFFTEAVRFLLANKHRGSGGSQDEDRLRRQVEVLAALAFAVMCAGDQEPRRERLQELLHDIAPADAGDLFAVFARAGVVRPFRRSEPEGKWVFHHRSFLEAMAARHLAATDARMADRARLHDERKQAAAKAIDEQVKRHKAQGGGGDDPARFWVEPFALTAGYLGDRAASWIEWLLSRDDLRAIGLMAVALADTQHVSANLLHDVLWQNRDREWTDRVPVYESLAPPFGRGADGDVRRALLQFVGHEREAGSKWWLDRNELWWIDRLFAQVARDATQPQDVRDEASRQRDELMHGIGVEKLPDDLVSMLAELPDSIEAGQQRDSYWRFVPAGFGWVGSPDGEQGRYSDERLVLLRVSRPFWMAEVHVTNALWGLFTGHGTRCTTKDARRAEPQREIPWYACSAFARWLHVRLAARLGGRFEIRLPTEWEWEYCARFRSVVTKEADLAGMPSPEFGWAVADDGVMQVTHANLDECWGKQRGAPGSTGDSERRMNPLGVRDLMRFLWTWCDNPYLPYVQCSGAVEAAVEVPSEVDPRARRVLRGGSFDLGADFCRAAYRVDGVPGSVWLNVGFRLVCVGVSPQLDR